MSNTTPYASLTAVQKNQLQTAVGACRQAISSLVAAERACHMAPLEVDAIVPTVGAAIVLTDVIPHDTGTNPEASAQGRVSQFASDYTWNDLVNLYNFLGSVSSLVSTNIGYVQAAIGPENTVAM